MNTRSLVILAAILLTAILAAQAAHAETRCVNPSRSGCHPTIQDAVNASSPGDKIVVHPHPDRRGYRENVVVSKNDLTIEGLFTDGGPAFDTPTIVLRKERDEDEDDDVKRREDPDDEGRDDVKRRCPKQILDTCETTANPASCGGDGFHVNATGVVLRNFTIRHSQAAVRLSSADGTHVANVCVFESVEGIVGSGNDVTVFRGKFLGIRIGAAIEVSGDHVTARANALVNTDGLNINGAGAKVTDSLFAVTTDRSCVRINGVDALVRHNTFDGCDSDAISVRGDRGKILRNRIAANPDDDSAIEADGNEMEIAHNRIELVSDSGIKYRGNLSRIHHNTVKFTGADGDEPGIEILGDDNVISHNTATGNTFAGISNDNGSRNLYANNLSTGNGQSGIRIENGSDNVVRDNRTLRNHGEGINNESTALNTVIVNNRSFGNRTDVCNDGTIATFSGNSFDTGGPSTACVVE